MKRVLTLLCLVSMLAAVEVPDVIPVAIEVTNVYMIGAKVIGQNITHELHFLKKEDYEKQYGPLTEVDINQYSLQGAIRRQLVLFHVTL